MQLVLSSVSGVVTPSLEHLPYSKGQSSLLETFRQFGLESRGERRESHGRVIKGARREAWDWREG